MSTESNLREIALHLLLTALEAERVRFAITHVPRRTRLTDVQKKELKELRAVVDAIEAEALVAWLATRGNGSCG